jgi:hypothetical protein
VTEGVFSDIVTISVLILINTYDKADPLTPKAGSTGPNVQLRKKTDNTVSQLSKSLCQAYSLLEYLCCPLRVPAAYLGLLNFAASLKKYLSSYR